MPVKVSKAMRNNELRGPTAIDTDIIPSDSEHVFAQEALYQEAMMRYHCAILEMRTKLEVLSKDMTVRYRRNPIEFIESRLKKPSSIARKLKKMGLEVTVDNMTQHLSDIAGIRVLCAYIDDIYEIARMLARQKDVRIITVKDYIKAPMDTKGNIEYPYTVPENSYFVMGDNRNASSDSRRKSVGAIPKENLMGKVVFRLYPFSSIGFIK